MAKPTSQKPRRDHYAEVTDKILAEMEKGQLTWRQPWDIGNAFAGASARDYMPQNGVSGRPYSGINKLLLMMDPLTVGTADPRWASYKQAQEKGWQVRGGEKGTTVFFFKKLKVAGSNAGGDDPDLIDGQRDAQALLGGGGGEEAARTIMLLRSYTVFHASQIDSIPPYEPGEALEQAWTPDEAGEHILQASGANIVHSGFRAYYSPKIDQMVLPPKTSFPEAAGYYSTALHELGHWTGHASRLARPMQGRFGTPEYAAEELRAELTSVFLGAATGIEPSITEAAAYIQDWAELLKSNKKEIFRAAADAQRAADYVLALAGMQPEVDMEFDADAVALPGGPSNGADPDLADDGRMALRGGRRR